MESGIEELKVPQDWEHLLVFLQEHKNLVFSSSRLSRSFHISSQRLSKILLELHRMGYLEKWTRGASRKKSYYRWKR